MKAKSFSLVLVLSLIILVFFACKSHNEKKDGNNADSSGQISKTNTQQSDSQHIMDFSVGQKIYEAKCQVCHQANGEGVSGTFPPLANSDYLKANKERAVKLAIFGSKVPITVNGVEYPGNIMTIVELSDQEVMDVVNYVLNSWGNKLGTVILDDVKKARNSN